MIVRVLALLAFVALPAQAQDKGDGGEREAADVLSAVLRVKAKILSNARSAETLGLQREGSGLRLLQGAQVKDLRLRSIDRAQHFRRKQSF